MIWLVRHGPVKVPQGMIYGWMDIEPLDPANVLFEHIKEKIPLGTIERVISSDLLRCRVPAEFAAKQLNLPLEASQELREQSFGRWEGLTWDDVKEREPDRWQEFFAEWIHQTPPNGESFFTMSERVVRFMENVVDDSLLIVHKGPIWSLLKNCQQLTKDEMMEVQVDYYSIHKAAGSK